jgi:ubiquitin-protein ligase
MVPAAVRKSKKQNKILTIVMIPNKSGAVKRLRKELLLLERSSSKSKGGRSSPDIDDVYLRPTNPESILRWTALIRGPQDVSLEWSRVTLDMDYLIFSRSYGM